MTAVSAIEYLFQDLHDPNARERAATSAGGGRWTRPQPYLDIRDAELVAGIRAGDAALFERLYNAYLTPLFEFALAYVREVSAAEDVVATVMANLWMRRASWTVRDRVETYLFGAVHHEVLSRRRTDARRTALAAAADDDTRATSCSRKAVG